MADEEEEKLFKRSCEDSIIAFKAVFEVLERTVKCATPAHLMVLAIDLDTMRTNLGSWIGAAPYLTAGDSAQATRDYIREHGLR